MQVHNVEQGTDIWFALRKGRMSASHAQAIGNCGKGLDTYIVELMSEYFSSGEKERFANKHTERGNELEDIAADMYELETGNTCEKVGFCSLDEYVGCSPDRLIGEDGLLEIKCPDDIGYFKMLLGGESEVDTKYLWQSQMQLLITGRKWNDLVFYNPNFEKSMLIFRQFPNKEKFDALEKGFAIGRQKINEIKQKLCK